MDQTETTLIALLAFVLLQNARPERAATLLSVLNIMEPANPRTLRSLAVAQLRSGKAEKALETLDQLAMAGGIDAAFHLLRAQALVALGRPLEAGVAMNTFIQIQHGSRGKRAP
jgi:predicted Zn-dependent protease